MLFPESQSVEHSNIVIVSLFSLDAILKVNQGHPPFDKPVLQPDLSLKTYRELDIVQPALQTVYTIPPVNIIIQLTSSRCCWVVLDTSSRHSSPPPFSFFGGWGGGGA